MTGPNSSIVILFFLRKSDLGITKNYRYMTLTPIAAKVYYVFLLNRFKPGIEKILRKNQNGFQEINHMISPKKLLQL